jgi:hypothetical protein
MTDTTPAEREALLDVTASLVAAVSLLRRGGKKAAPSDRMFEQMLLDYENSIERGRAAWQARVASQPVRESHWPATDIEGKPFDSQPVQEPVALVDLSAPEPRLVQLGPCLTHGQELYAAPPSDDEAVRLLHHVRMVLPDDRWADDTKRAIDAYLARVNK